MARGSIIKKGDNYYIVYRVNGRQKWKAAGTSKKVAERILTETVRAIHLGEYKELKEITFGDFATKWLKEYAEGRVKPSTLKSYRQIVRRHLSPFFGETKLNCITPDQIQDYVSSKTEDGKLSPKTINNTLVPLKEMFKHAVIWGYLRESPAKHVEKPRVESKEMDFLTPNEIRRFLKNVSPKWYPLFLTAVLTGMRRGELLGLQWGDVDWASTLIFVTRSLYNGQFVTPKSKRSFRSIVVSPTLASVLRKHQLSSGPNDLDLVFANEVGQSLDPDNLIKREFFPALRRAKLRKIRFHDLRHTYTALLISQGENVKFIQSQLGHASIQTTLDRYGHLIPEVHAGVGERLDETVFSKSVRKVLENGCQESAKALPDEGNALLDTGSGARI